MFINIRKNSVPYYRLLFIALFLSLGLVGIACAALYYFTGVSLFATISEIDQQALHASVFAIGSICFLSACLMTYLLKEKRNSYSDRRKNSQSIHFRDRRRLADRRNTPTTK